MFLRGLGVGPRVNGGNGRHMQKHTEDETDNETLL